jgi:ribosomal protein S27E
VFVTEEVMTKNGTARGYNDIADFAYITKRKLKDANGEMHGEVFLWRRKGEDEFNYKLKCPYCELEQESSIIFERRPYRVRCSNCGKSIMLEKLSKK